MDFEINEAALVLHLIQPWMNCILFDVMHGDAFTFNTSAVMFTGEPGGCKKVGCFRGHAS